VGLVESCEEALRTVSVGLGSLERFPGSGFTMLGAVSPFSVVPLDEGGALVPPVPGFVPWVFPRLELPRGSTGSSSLQPAAARRATANANLGE
jgi:hypothetical protein